MPKNGSRLTYAQLKFIAHRPWADTDAEAAAEAGVTPQTVCGWKDNPLFVEELESIWTGSIRRTQEIIARTRDEAALTLKGLLTARDKRVQRQTAVDLLKFGGLVQGESIEHGVSSALAELLSKAKEEEKDEGDKSFS